MQDNFVWGRKEKKKRESVDVRPSTVSRSLPFWLGVDMAFDMWKEGKSVKSGH